MTDCAFDDSLPWVHVSVYVKEPSVVAVCVTEPEVARFADQGVPLAPPPLPAQLVAFVDDQVKVNDWLSWIDVADAVSVAVGAGSMVTVACAVALGSPETML